MAGPQLVERLRCPACGHDDTPTIYRVGYDDDRITGYLDRFYGGRAEPELLADADFELCRCRRCGLRFQRMAPDEALLTRIYDHWIDPDAAKAHKLAQEPAVAPSHRALLARLGRIHGGPLAGLTVLDVGMGWGGLLRVARSEGCRVIGVELSEERHAAACADGIEVVTPGDLGGGDLDAAVDLVIAVQTFEHLVDPMGVARTIGQVLRPGGLARIEVPNGVDRRMLPLLRRADWDAPKGTRWSLNPVAPLEHLNCFGHRSLRILGTRAGLRPLAVRSRLVAGQPGSPRSRLLGTGAIAATFTR